MDTIALVENWIRGQSLLETFGVITGILCVYLAAKNNIWNWPVAIVSVAIYTLIFFDAKLYADMGLQVYFLFTVIYGWYFWSRKLKNTEKVPVSRISTKAMAISVITIGFFTAGLGFYLKGTDASFPYIDSFCTACSFVAQIFLARKVIENWLIWIFVDLIYVGVYISKGLYLTSGMYVLYIFIALVGYIEWRKNYYSQLAERSLGKIN